MIEVKLLLHQPKNLRLPGSTFRELVKAPLDRLVARPAAAGLVDKGLHQAALLARKFRKGAHRCMKLANERGQLRLDRMVRLELVPELPKHGERSLVFSGLNAGHSHLLCGARAR